MSDIRFYFIKKPGYCQQLSKKVSDSKSNCQNICEALIACKRVCKVLGKVKENAVVLFKRIAIKQRSSDSNTDYTETNVSEAK